MYGYYITQKGADLMAQAVIDESKVTITQCAVGDGGDAEAEKDLSRTALNNETYRKSFDIEDSYALAPDDTDTVMIECMIPSEAGELTVSEIGFFDDEGNLIAYGVLKEQVLGSDSDGLEYSLDIVSFIELSPEQLSVLKVDLGKANVQAISERVDEFESTVNSTVDQFKTTVNDRVKELENKIDEYHPLPAYLCEGQSFNDKIKAIEGYNTSTSLVFTKDSPTEDKVLTDVSRDSDNSAVAWVDDTTIYVSGYGKILSANSDSSYMFRSFRKMSIDFSNFDTSQVTDMSYMFYNNSSESLDLSNFDTSKVTNMYGMFDYNKATSINLSSFDTSQVTRMDMMFERCYVTSLDLSNFNTSKVTTMEGMFDTCYSLESLDITSFDTSSVTNMDNMFTSCPVTTLDVSSFDTSNVTTMERMFSRTKTTNLDLSNFYIPNVKNMDFMFSRCKSLITLDVSNFDLTNMREYNMHEMFLEDSQLTTIYAQDWTVQLPSLKRETNNMFKSCTSLPNFNESNTGGAYAKPISEGGYFTDPSLAPPKPVKKTLEERVEDLEEAVKNGTGGGSSEPETFETVKLKAEYILDNLSGYGTNPKVVFTDATPPSSVSPVDCSENGDGSVVKWNVGNTIYISSKTPGVKIQIPLSYSGQGESGHYLETNIFSYVTSDQQEIGDAMQWVDSTLSVVAQIDLSNATVEKNIALDGMFSKCYSLESIDLTPIEDCQPTSMANMFASCKSLTYINFGNFDTSLVTNMSYLFDDCNSLSYVDLSSFDTSSVTDMTCLFDSCIKLRRVDISNFDMSSVTKVSNMFYDCYRLSKIICNDDWTELSQITSSYNPFNNCFKLPGHRTYHTASETFDHAKPISKGGYFSPYIPIEVELEDLHESLAGPAFLYNCDYSIINFENRLTDCGLGYENVNNATSLVFTGKLPPEDIQTYDMSQDLDRTVVTWIEGSTIYISAYGKKMATTSCYHMFDGLSNLQTIDLSYLDTSRVTDMSNMFWSLDNLTEIDLTPLDTSRVQTMGSMFGYCPKLKTIDMSTNCFDSLRKDGLRYTFDECSQLTTIYCNQDLSTNPNIAASVGTFEGCTKLPSYSKSKITGEYAKPSSNGGYFSHKRTIEERLDLLEGVMST